MEGKRGKRKSRIVIPGNIVVNETYEKSNRRAMGRNVEKTGCLKLALEQNTNDDAKRCLTRASHSKSGVRK